MTPAQKAMLATLTPGYDSRHVQAFVQIALQTPGAYGTDLDTMTPQEVATVLALAKACVKAAGPEIAERLAAARGF
ncbi:MAG: hypothetical protein ACYCQM_14605 [Acidithiobacillus sp.]